MTEISGRILKSDDVELDGQYRLGLVPDKSDTSGAGHANAVMAAPQAQIIENHPGHAVIEVTCSCGAQVCLKCEYSDVEVSGDS